MSSGTRFDLLKAEAITPITDDLKSTVEVYRNQAELAAIAAGATLYDNTSNGLSGTSDGDVFLVSTDPGVQVYRNDTGSATLLGWLGEVLFDDVSTLLASTSTFAAGTILRTREEGFAYKAVASGGHVTNAGAQEFEVFPGADGRVIVTAFGVTGSGDESAAIQTAYTNFDSVVFPEGTFTVGSSITLKSGNKTFGAGRDKTIITRSNGAVFSGTSSATGAYLEGIKFHGVQLLGTVDVDGFYEFHHLIDVNGVRNMVVNNCTFKGFRGDGIYLGANSDNTRHNLRVRITNNLFDGVNKDNRNGLSVIDCDDLKVTGNTFIRCSRFNMPGPIDIEPNDAANVIKNISITGNNFEDTDCAIAAITVAIASVTLTTDPTNFNFSKNTFDIDKRMVAFLVNATYTTPHNLIVSGNTGKCSIWINCYPRLIGATIANNAIQVTGGNLGLAAGDAIENVTLSGNSFDGAGTATRAFYLRDGDGISITGNTFSNFTTVGFLCGIASGGLSNVAIVGNTFISTGANSVGIAGVIDGASCVFKNNNSSVRHNFPAWITDDCGDVENADTSPESFNADNPPGDFPRGATYMALINGDTAVPNVGGRQGILKTHAEGAFRDNKYKYQTYWPANNTVGLGSFYIRKATNATTWAAWYEVAGV